MTHDVFISYSARDKAVADAACAALEANGTRCWIAPRDVPPGRSWAASLVEAIGRSRILVLILSEGSNASPQVNREVGEAVDNGLPIIPFRIEDVQPSDEMRYYIKSIHWLDALTPPLERHLSRLSALVDAALEVESAADTVAPAPDITTAAPRPRRRLPARTLAVIGATLAMVVVGSLVFALSRSGSDPGDEGQTLSFVVPNDSQWSSPAPETYRATGSDDTFAWTEETIEGDFALEIDVTSDFTGFGEGMVVVYGDGPSWSQGSLIFNITGAWQAVRAHTIYDGTEWLFENQMVLDGETSDTFTMKIEVVGDFGSLLVDDQKVASVVLSPEMNRSGRIALVKYGQSAPVTYSNIRFDSSPEPTTAAKDFGDDIDGLGFDYFTMTAPPEGAST